MYDNYKVYGPYRRKDGRQHVILVSATDKKTVSYPKFLTENRIGRYLTDDETVDHIDNDFNNNDPSNIRIIDRATHASEDAKRHTAQSFVCPVCGVDFTRTGRQLCTTIADNKRGKAGPFCSRSCTGKYGKSVQMGQKKLEVVKITPEYTTTKRASGETRFTQRT